jgi:hypothetical protein
VGWKVRRPGIFGICKGGAIRLRQGSGETTP